jgi:hypothetical protein
VSTRWPSVKVECSHGITDGDAEFIQRYRHIGDRWVATRTPLQQQLRGDEPFSFSQQSGMPIRERHELTCKTCQRNVIRRDEVLQEQLYRVVLAGIDTLELCDMG